MINKNNFLKQSNTEIGIGRDADDLFFVLSSFYLLLPTLFFAYGWLRWPINFITMSMIVLFLVMSTKDAYQIAIDLWDSERVFLRNKRTILWIAASLLMIIIWLSFSAVGGLGYQNDDYNLKNAILRELIAQEWPISTLIEGAATKFVYYMNYYLVAAAFGKIFGWIGANIFMILWSFVGVILAFAWFLSVGQIAIKDKVSRLFPLVFIFCLASGVDFFGAYILKDIPFSWGRHIEFWVEYFQYSSNTTLIYWVPQHAIPSWLLSGMVITSIYKTRNLKYLGISMVAGFLWSPFAIVSIFPYFVILSVYYLFSPQNRKFIFNYTSFLFNGMAVWMGGIYVLFIASNNFSFPATFIWRVIENRRFLAITLLKFWFVEFGLLAFLVFTYFMVRCFAYLSKYNRHEHSLWSTWFNALDKNFDVSPLQFGMFSFSIFILIVLPFFKMGFFNDIVMRGSMSALFIFWATISKIILKPSFRKDFQMRFDFSYPLIILVLLLGFLTSYSEIVRSVENYKFGPPSYQSVPALGNEDRLDIAKQKTGDDASFFYQYLGK